MAFDKPPVASFNWFTLTASVPFTPGPTLVIVLPPLSKPFLVRLTVFPLAGVIVTPPPFITVVLPAASLVVTVSRPFKSFAIRTLRLPAPSDTTPKLSSVVNLLASVIPPITFTCSLSFFLITSPESPPYFIPSSLVATWCVLPVSSWYLMRVISLPSRSGSPFSTVISALRPSLPFKPMWPMPSLPDMDTASLPSLPVIPTLPSVPSAPLGPVIDTPSWPFLPTFTLSVVKLSVLRFFAILILTLPSWSATVLIFSPEYLSSDSVPSPLIVTFWPRLRWNSPVLPAKSIPFFVISSPMLLILLSKDLWDFCNWSSVAARPLVMLSGSQSLFSRPVT